MLPDHKNFSKLIFLFLVSAQSFHVLLEIKEMRLAEDLDKTFYLNVSGTAWHVYLPH